MTYGRFTSRVSVVTGAGKGIGLAILRRLIAEGATVAAFDLDADALQAAVVELAAGDALHTTVVDVADAEALESAVVAIGNSFGRIDVLVNNAGMQHHAPISTLSTPQWDLLHAVNLRASFITIRSAAPYMADGDGVSVVNVASVDGIVGEAGVAAYSAAKAGLVNFTRAAALEFAPRGVRVNVVCPGMTDTPMFRATLDAAEDRQGELAQRLRRVPTAASSLPTRSPVRSASLRQRTRPASRARRSSSTTD